jgi:cyclase
MIELDSNIFVETEYLGSNNSIVCTPAGLVLIDSPHRPTDAMRWRRIAEAAGEAAYLINTDHHIDHTMGNYFLPGVIVSHARTRRMLQEKPPTRQYIDGLLDVIDPAGQRYMGDWSQRLPTITYQTRMELAVGGLTFEITHVPGHTPNNSLIWLPQQQVLFTGDLVCEVGMPAFIEANVYACLDAVRLIEQLPVRYLVPGHGQVCGLAEARRFREWIEGLLAEVEDRIDRGLTREQIMDEVAYEDRIHIAMGGSAGYPQYLMDKFMRNSIGAIYDDVQARRNGVPSDRWAD